MHPYPPHPTRTRPVGSVGFSHGVRVGRTVKPGRSLDCDPARPLRNSARPDRCARSSDGVPIGKVATGLTIYELLLKRLAKVMTLARSQRAGKSDKYGCSNYPHGLDTMLT